MEQPVLKILWFFALVSCAGQTTSFESGGADGNYSDAASDVQDTSGEWIAPFDGFNPPDGSGLGDLITAPDSYGGFDVTIVEGSPECVPDGSSSTAYGSCCNHEPCYGQCAKLDDGGVGCWCEGIWGGCWPGAVCCHYSGGCTAPGSCAW